MRAITNFSRVRCSALDGVDLNQGNKFPALVTECMIMCLILDKVISFFINSPTYAKHVSMVLWSSPREKAALFLTSQSASVVHWHLRRTLQHEFFQGCTNRFPRGRTLASVNSRFLHKQPSIYLSWLIHYFFYTPSIIFAPTLPSFLFQET